MQLGVVAKDLEVVVQGDKDREDQMGRYYISSPEPKAHVRY